MDVLKRPIFSLEGEVFKPDAERERLEYGVFGAADLLKVYEEP